MFVDDKNLMHNRKQPYSTATELMSYVTHDILLWDRYIWITGGLVEQLKTKYSLMVWKFQTTGAPTITPGNELPTNTVKLHRPDYSTTVKQTDPNKADKLVGVHTAVTQQTNTEYNYTLKKIKEFFYAFKTYPANFHDIWILYSTVLKPSICFSIPAVTFMEKQTT
eukprot:2463271-Ditylum_brightwellii.AAC.1